MADQFPERRGISSVPPPPPEAGASLAEVTIRTMASDLAMVGEHGGSMPVGEKLSITLSGGGGSVLPHSASSASGSAVRASSLSAFRPILFVLGACVGLALLFAAGYYLLPLLFPGGETESATGDPSRRALSDTAPHEPVFFGHESFFRAAADASFEVSLGGFTEPLLPHAFGTLVRERLASYAPADGPFFEVLPRAGEGRHPAWGEFSDGIGASLLARSVWEQFFETDFTAFAYRGENGAAELGYILKLKSGYVPLAIQSVVREIERRQGSIAALFAAPPGTFGLFSDAQISGQPVRRLSYDDTGASFLYGWFYNSYLILSTSEEGMREAVRRL